MLYQCYEAVSNGQPYDHIFNAIKERYTSIVTGLELDYDIVCHLDHVYKTLPSTVTPDYAASRGEYLNGLLLAAYLGDRLLMLQMLFSLMLKDNSIWLKQKQPLKKS